MESDARSTGVQLKKIESPDEIRKGWAEHFQELATPLSNPKFDEQYKQMVWLMFRS